MAAKRGKHILLTGATGYLGGRLARQIVEDGHVLSILKRRSSRMSRLSDLSVTAFDIDDGGLEPIFNSRREIDAIIHTAACYGRSGETCEQIVDANTVFPLRLLEASVAASVPLFINTATSLPRETNAYALSKAQFSDWGLHFGSEGRITFVNVKLEHFYGAHDDESKFVTFLIRQCLQGAGDVELTAGEQLRDFVHVDDVVSAFRLLLGAALERKKSVQQYELGSGVGVTIRELAETVRELSGSKTKLLFGARPYRRNEIMRLIADITALRELGWKPTVALHDGLRKTIDEEMAS